MTEPDTGPHAPSHTTRIEERRAAAQQVLVALCCLPAEVNDDIMLLLNALPVHHQPVLDGRHEASLPKGEAS